MQRLKSNLKNRRIILLLLACVVVGLSGYFLYQQYPAFHSSLSSLLQPSKASSPRNATLVTIGKEGISIPADFIGFNIELSQICEIINLDEQNHQYYEQLYSNLGTSVIHMGGHSADLSKWVPNGVATCNTSYTIVTKALIDEFFAFVHKIHWKVFWGLNLIVNDPRSAANEAAYVTAVGGAALIGFTIGNEPELYTKQGFRPSGWGYADYLQEWDQYRKAVLNAVSSAKFAGPDACCDSPLFPNFLANERKNIVIATHHYYVGAIHQTPATLSLLLSEQVAQQFISDASEWSAMAREVRLPLEISESNTYSGGGVPGVSDSFAAALWASDYLFQAAELGIRRIDFQSSQFAIYNAIDDNGRPKALYYGLLFFHYVTEYAHIVQTTISAAYNITAYAVISSGGSLHVILVNKQNQHAATVEIDTGKLYHSASIIRLTAPSIGATSGITVGGGTVSAQGTWVPLSSESLPLSGTEVKVQVPAGSAASVDLIE